MALLTVEMNDQTKSKVISVGLHVLILLLALWPIFQDSSNWKDDSTVVIQFSESVSTQPDNSESQSSPKGDRSTTNQASTTSAPENNNTPSSATAPPSITEDRSEVQRAEQSTSRTQESTPAKEEKPQSRDFGNLFGSGTQTSGQSGSPDGDPDVSQLKGLSKGEGTVGRGLAGREIVFKPRIEDNSQKTGRVVIEICVNAEGQVESANYTQRGSNTNDLHLVELAEKAAWKYRFSSSETARQCGVITIDFKVQ
jgi:hypothetical protein